MSGIPVGLGEKRRLTCSENSHTLIGYLGEVFSVELRLLKMKARLCVILHWSDNKTTTQKQLETVTRLPMFLKSLSPSTEPKTNLSLFESGSQLEWIQLEWLFSSAH